LPEELRLDGMSYTTKPMGKTETQLGAYAGIPVHLYEDDTDEGQAYGLFVEGLAGKDGRARFDWMHLEDELVLEDHRNDLFSVALWENFSENVRFEGQYSHLDSDPRDLRLRVFVDTPDATTIVRASYYQLLETQTAEATEIDPFFEELLDYFPFRQGTVNVSQLLGENTTLDVGFDARRVSDSDDIGDFNRDWERYYTTLALGLDEHETTLSVTADLWEGGDRDTSTFGADLSFSPSESFDAAIGSYYSLYKYDLFEFEERDDVRTYYARIDHETSKQVKFELIYEFENDDLDTYHTLRLGAVWQF
jgi:hypothetical protein